MKKIVLLTGSRGFIGKSILRCAGAFEDLSAMALTRSEAAEHIIAARRDDPEGQISLLNLAWPSLQQYSASLEEQGGNEDEWRSYKVWLGSLVNAAAQANIRFFQIGSGIEPYALGDKPTIGEPYLGYARRKDEIWRQVEAALPGASWRLRLHFLFGSGEASHRFIPTAIHSFQTGAPLALGAPERRRCWLHVDDAARGLLAAVLADAPESWDVCGATPVSFTELLTLISEVTAGRAKIIPPQRETPDSACLVAAPEKLAPFMPYGIGAPDNLRQRLTDYAQALAS